MATDSITVMRTDPRSAAGEGIAPPGPLREFWGYFSANHGAVAGWESLTCGRPASQIVPDDHEPGAAGEDDRGAGGGS